ncbi:MAG: AsmA family protein [Geminicoccaceae bacterium]|nr:AsmA family protein [Geminicoccaceae bacterium]
MRRALGLALVGLALAAALFLAPRLLDGEAVRARLLERLEATTGRPVRVRGATSFTLLPEPRLSVAEVAIGDPRIASEPFLAIERVDALIGFAGLLGLAPELREVRLVRPRLVLPRAPDPVALVAAFAGLRGPDSPIGSLSIVDGRLSLRDPRLVSPIELVAINAEAAREAESGLFALGGGGRWRGEPLTFSAELRPVGSGPLPLALRLGLGSGEGAARLGWRGAIAVERSGLRAEGELELAADTSELARHLAELGGAELAARIPRIGALAARGRVRADPARIEIEPLRLATPAGELSGSLRLGSAPSPSFALALESNRLELPADVVPTRALPLLWAEPPEALEGTVAIRIGSLVRAGEELRRLRLELRLSADGGVDLERLEAELPGTGDLELTGRRTREPAGPTWRGRLALRAEDPAPGLRWLGVPVEPWTARLGPLAASGTLRLEPEGASLAEAEIRLAAATLRGSLAVLAGPPPRLVLRGRIDRLVLDPWLDGAAAATLRDWLVSGPPATAEVEVDLALDRLAWRGSRAERVVLKGELAEGRLRLDELALGELGGATARLVGTLGPGPASALDAELAIAEPGRFGRALGLDPLAFLLLEGPIRGRASFSGGADGRRLEAGLEGPDGSAGFTAALRADGLAADRIEARVEIADSAALLARLGTQGPLAPGLAGRFSLAAEAVRYHAEGWRIGGRLGLGRIGGRAELDLVEGLSVPVLRGELALERLDAASLAELYRIAEPLSGLPRGPLRSWPGAWPRQPFGPAILPPLDLDLALSLALESADGTPLGPGGAKLALAGRAVALDEIDLPLARGRLRGRLLAELGRDAARLEGALSLATAALPELAGALRAGEPAGGILDLELEAASEGRSLWELVANLTGRGAITLREFSTDGLPIEPGAPALVRGPFTLERGIARARELLLEWPGRGERPARLGFDLAAWILEVAIEEPGDPPRAVRWVGPPDRLHRLEPGEPPSRAAPLAPRP